MEKMKKCLSLLLAAVLVLSLAPAAAAAEGPRVVCGDAQTTPGGWFSLTIHAENLEDLASLELEVYYDASVLSLQSHSVEYLLSDCVTSINADTPGVIRLRTASATGVSGEGGLLHLYFRVADDCEPGRYPLTVAAGEAYDTALEPVSIESGSGCITVTPGTVEPGYFRMELRADRQILQKGDRITLTVRNEWQQPLAGCALTLDYDSSLFRLVEAELPEDMKQNGAVFSLNDALEGTVRLTWAAMNDVWSYEMLTVTLEATENVDAETVFTARAFDLYAADLSPYAGVSDQATVQLQSTTEIKKPRLWLESEQMTAGEQCVSTLMLEADSGVAAADFTMTYDPEALTCADVEAAELAEGQVVINPNYQNGTIRFSFVDEDGAQAETALIRITWIPKGHYTVTTSGYKVVDADFEPVVLEYAESTGCIYRLETTEPTCETPGGSVHICTCGQRIVLEELPALGHDWDSFRCRRCGERKENPFTDVPEGSFYFEPVMWAVANGVTNGTTPTTFGPGDQCMRAHVVTFLWRAAGCPEPIRTDNPFVDVKPTDFYCKAVLWAVEKGITNGLDATHFGPFAYCNRAQVVTFLHRTLGNPKPESTDNPFTDVQAGSFYYAPVLWAVEKGITNGLSATQFGPTAICNRAQIVTFLYRAFAG